MRSRPANVNGHRAIRRRGVAIILILALISITLGLSYAMLRTQVTESIVQGNLGRTEDASHAARAGASIALQSMHSSNWEGVETSFAGQLSAHQQYTVQYTFGDSQLHDGHADYQEYPYRVTVTVVGTATQPGNSGVHSKHTIRFVVQLARTHLQSTPAGWAPTKTHALFQTSHRDPNFELPLDIDGPVLITGGGQLAEDYPPIFPRFRYISDLASMHRDGVGDYRPFDTVVRTTEAGNLFNFMVSRVLKVPVEIVGSTSVSSIAFPDDSVTSYRLYPGGPSYEIPVYDDKVLDNFSFRPSVMDNPLGVLRLSEGCRLMDNVAIEGTVLAKKTIDFKGSNTSITSPRVPNMVALQLPALVASDDLNFDGNSSVAIAGAVACFETTTIDKRTTSAPLSLRGPWWTNEFTHRGRQEWDVSDKQWTAWLAEFEDQLLDKDITPVPYFPMWLEKAKGLKMQSAVTLARGPSEVIHHWTDWSKPLYEADPQTGGLHWNVVRWDDLGQN